MPTLFKVKRRHTDDTAPTTGDIAEGELAINTASRALYSRDDDDNIIRIGGTTENGTTDGTFLTWNSITELWEETTLGSTLRPDVYTDATTARTISSADENAIILFTNASAVTVTLPTDTDDNLPIGFLCHLHQEGAGQVTADDTDITLRHAVGPSTYEQYSSISIIKIGSDTWKVVGDQAA